MSAPMTPDRVRTDALQVGDRLWHPYDMVRFTVGAAPAPLDQPLTFHNRATDEMEPGMRVTGTDDRGDIVRVDVAPSYLWHRDVERPTAPEAEPLVVRRFDIAMEPAPEEEQVLTIGCIAADGRPVALLLNLDDRPKVAGWLALEPGTSMHTTLTEAYLAAWEEQRENVRLRLALASARRGRREARAGVAALKRTAVLAEEDYRRIVRGACLVESQLRARVAELEALQLGAVDGRVSATCDDPQHPTWLRAADDTRECPWCRVAELEAAQSTAVADRDAQIIAWLLKKAGEYRGVPRSRQESAADAIARMADKISRGAVRGTETASPWDRAVAGLNALVDADVIFHVEPDGHISAPFSDEHIEWDLKARRWVLTHDEDEGATPDSPPDPLTYGPTGYRCGCGKDAHSNLTACQPMTADEWNARYPVGTPVLAYPDTRDDEPLDTVTRTPAWTLGHGAAVVSVEGESGGICLTHVDPILGGSDVR
ncbi:hypothetical protein ACWC9Q_18295 [Streptomyces sp. NPDC001142]